MVQLLRVELMSRNAIQKGRRRQHVPVGLDLDLAIAKCFCEQSERRRSSESPGIGIPVPFVATDLTDSGEGGQKCPVGFQYPMECSKRSSDVMNKLQSMGKDNAVEAVRRNMRRVRQVGDDRGTRKSGADVKHVLLRDAETSKPFGISMPANF